MTRVVRTPDGSVLVPGNRWDLVPIDRQASVSVVIPYHEGPADLRRLVASLDVQDHPVAEVIVADDGSRRHPAPEVLSDRPEVHPSTWVASTSRWSATAGRTGSSPTGRSTPVRSWPTDATGWWCTTGPTWPAVGPTGWRWTGTTDDS